MLSTIIAISLIAAPQAAEPPQPLFTTLYRGVELPGHDTRYWSAEDIAIDRDYPTRSNGQGTLIRLGRNKRGFIRFGDLERALGASAGIGPSRLVLTTEHLVTAGEVRLYRMSAPWAEGPGTGESLPRPAQWGTTWEFQFFNEKGRTKRWRNGGAEFMAREPSATARVELGQREVVLTGVEDDVRHFYDRWYDNHGWAIEFTGEGSVNSSQSDRGQPRLEVQVLNNRAQDRVGPDLSVIYISRAPEYERYDPTSAYVQMEVGGHTAGVMMNPGLANTKKWPADNEQVTYTAVVKNVGTAPATGFTYEWSADFERAGRGDITRSVAPGETVQVTYQARFRNEHHDHRTQPIGFRIHPTGPDALPGNDYLEVQANALNLGIWVDETFYKKFGEKVNGVGSRSFEDWIQWQFRIWNDVFLRHSRFSFAPDGSRERTRIQKITIVPDGTLAGGVHTPGNKPTFTYDGEWGFDSSFGEAEKYMDAVRTTADRALIHEVSHQISLIDLYWMNVDPSMPDGAGGEVRLKHNGHVVTRGVIDAFGGLMGGGDTRNETLVPGTIAIPSGHADNPLFRSPLFLPTDLYAMTDVFALDAALGHRRGYFGDFMYSVPGVVMTRVVDRNGNDIPAGTLSFYQMKGGEIKDLPPDFTLPVDRGTAMLPARLTGLSDLFTTLTGHTLKPNPFGRVDVVGFNGVFLVALDTHGQREWAWLKIWQLVDAFARGNQNVYIHELRFNVTQKPLKMDTDWALKKIAIDSANSSSANLANLLDGDPRTFYEASGASDAWIEIDIGRDRPIGEIRLVMTGEHGVFWDSFDILAYGTGQTLSMARLYASERDWRRAISFDRDVDPEDFDIRSVAYRSGPQTARFIRIVNKSKTNRPAKLAGVVVRETEF